MVEQLQKTLHEQAERMSRLVEQLLDMSRLDATSVRISPEPLQLRAELERIVKETALGREHTVDVVAPEETVVADRAVLERVIGNLVMNALRYGTPPIRVVARKNAYLHISVEDSGEGIEPDFVPNLFDRFQRSDAARQSGTGAGLGLSIARLYARAHGGDVVYDPDVNGGARFNLVLPT
jgi:signal transduction histidine kinase